MARFVAGLLLWHYSACWSASALDAASDDGSLLSFTHFSIADEQADHSTRQAETDTLNELNLAETEATSGTDLRCSSAALLGRGMTIVTPHSATYEHDRQQWASRMGSQEESDHILHPHLIIFCKTEEDVVHAVNYARMCGCKVSVRSGGHQYAGLSSCEKGSECVQLDVSQLETFNYNAAENLVTLGVGLDLQQVWQKLMPLGLSIPMGICNTVNVGGHFQSSSLGFLSRAEGLGMDHVQSFKIVLADGVVHTVSRDSPLGCDKAPCDKNLFWAVLGGGPGSWGVVLEYTVSPVRDSKYPSAAAGMYMWPFNEKVFVETAKVWKDVVQDPKYERDLQAWLVGRGGMEKLLIPQLKAVHGDDILTHYMMLHVVWTGGDNGEMTDDIMKETVDKVTAVPKSMGLPLLPVPGTGSMVKAPLGPMLNAQNTDFAQPAGFRYHIHSITSDGVADPDFIERAASEINRRKAQGMYSFLEFYSLGGAHFNGGKGGQMNRNDDGRNAFPARDMAIHVDDWVWFPSDKAGAAEKLQQTFRNETRRFWERENSADNIFMTPHTSPDYAGVKRLEDYADYYPTQKQVCDLVKVKSEVDGDDLFHSKLTISSNKSGHLYLHC